MSFPHLGGVFKLGSRLPNSMPIEPVFTWSDFLNAKRKRLIFFDFSDIYRCFNVKLTYVRCVDLNDISTEQLIDKEELRAANFFVDALVYSHAS
jgi:hypothetical protein